MASITLLENRNNRRLRRARVPAQGNRLNFIEIVNGLLRGGMRRPILRFSV